MYNKRLIALFLIFICTVNAAKGMEIVKDVVKNNVVSAAGILATGAVLGAANSVVYSWLNNSSNNKKNIIKSALNGSFCAASLVGSAYAFSSKIPPFNAKISLIGAGLLFYGVPACLYIEKNKRERTWKQGLNVPEIETDYEFGYQKKIDQQLNMLQLFSTGVVSACILAGRIINSK
jgi:NhaP-type Na+/H+ or K+/H+ antiporter